MTTEFDSFDEGDLGDFTESPLGARNVREILDIVVFIDETANAYQTTEAQEDLAAWRSALIRYPTLTIRIAHVMSGSTWAPIWPASLTFPPNVDVVQVQRPPSVSETNRLFQAIVTSERTDLGPRAFVILVDNSGSMTFDDIAPTFDPLVQRLESSGVVVSVIGFFSEEWLGEALSKLLPE